MSTYPAYEKGKMDELEVGSRWALSNGRVVEIVVKEKKSGEEYKALSFVSTGATKPTKAPSRVTTCKGASEAKCKEQGCTWVVSKTGKKNYCRGSATTDTKTKDGPVKHVATTRIVAKASEDDASFFSDMCKDRTENVCKKAPQCRWLGGKVNRCQRAIGDKAVDAMGKLKTNVTKFKAAVRGHQTRARLTKARKASQEEEEEIPEEYEYDFQQQED